MAQDTLLEYCRTFTSISETPIERNKLAHSTQCEWFVDGLPEGIRELLDPDGDLIDKKEDCASKEPFNWLCA